MSKDSDGNGAQLALVIALIVGGALLAAFLVIPSSNGERMSDGTRNTLIGVLAAIAGLAVLVWAISAGVRSGLATREKELRGRQPTAPRQNQPRGFPVVQSGPLRKFFVCGVRRDTSEDVKIRIDAETEANARAKGELQGIVVTEVLEI